VDREELKRKAGLAAAAEVEQGMVVGLGTGSTVRYTIEELGRRVKTEGLRIVGIPTSKASEALARSVGIPLSDLDQHPHVDLTIDGADEVDPKLRLIKGGGGALTREKVVAAASRRMVVVADEAKLVETLGQFPLPIEVLPFAKTPVQRWLGEHARLVSVRRDDEVEYHTDNGNVILDAKFGRIDDPEALERTIGLLPGVVCVGLFNGLCHAAYIASEGGVKVLDSGKKPKGRGKASKKAKPSKPKPAKATPKRPAKATPKRPAKATPKRPAKPKKAAKRKR
jgi:ribose 5-phosphate isomerase A